MNYKDKLKTAWSGVAVLKLDDNIKFWTRSAVGCGFQIDGHRTERDGSPGIIIKAKLDKQYVCPRKLKNRKVFYRFYKGQDNTGTRRSYLVLAARTGDFVYRGSRCVFITRNDGAFLILEPSFRKKLQALWVFENSFKSDFADDEAAKWYPSEGY